MSFPVVASQRFWPTRLNELIDPDTYQIEKYIEGVENPRKLADKVIRDIEYPFHHGQPDDLHIWNAFHGKRCFSREEDFWQKGSETAAIKMGDCEDSSILYATAARRMGVKPEDVFVVFGYVEKDGELLGGHAWIYVRHPSFGDDNFHYVETTLDTPPQKYPIVPDIGKTYSYGGMILHPEILWNDEIYRQIAAPLGYVIYWLHRYFGVKKKITGYLDLVKRHKETRKKYETLERAWGIENKFMKNARKSMMFKIRYLLGKLKP